MTRTNRTPVSDEMAQRTAPGKQGLYDPGMSMTRAGLALWLTSREEIPFHRY
jgi:hypothetical protein